MNIGYGDTSSLKEIVRCYQTDILQNMRLLSSSWLLYNHLPTLQILVISTTSHVGSSFLHLLLLLSCFCSGQLFSPTKHKHCKYSLKEWSEVPIYQILIYTCEIINILDLCSSSWHRAPKSLRISSVVEVSFIIPNKFCQLTPHYFTLIR